MRLGARLTLRGGREALVRLVLTTLAVGLGVSVLLGLLSEFNAYQKVSGRACWECSKGSEMVGRPIPAGHESGELWDFSLDFYQGTEIRRLDVAALGPQAPVIPTLPRVPANGEYFVSPALADLLARTPHDQLGDRFPGVRAGLIGRDALIGPDELTVVVGHRPEDVAALGDVVLVDAVSTAAEPSGTTSIYRFAFAFGTVALFVPLTVLVGTATRLSAARREERYAAMRLVGGTPRQIGVVASVEAFVGALLGAVLGIGAFTVLQSRVARISVTGTRFFPQTVTPTPRGYLAALVGVPVLAAVAAVWALRRVRLDPLGVSRKTTPKPLRFRRVVPLLVGVVLWIGGLAAGGEASSDVLAYVCTPLVMLGLILAGPWLTFQASRLLTARARGASSMLAGRRLADDPRAAFRMVSGLTIAVFVGTAVAGVLPTALAAATGGQRAPLDGVLRARYDEGGGTFDPNAVPGIPPAAARDLLSSLRNIPGVSAIPVYADPSVRIPTSLPPGATPPVMPNGQPFPGPPVLIARCSDIRALPALGGCAPGVDVTGIEAESLFIDNPLRLRLPVVFPEHNLARPGTQVDRLSVTQLLVMASDPVGLEKARTYLALHTSIPTGAIGPDAWATNALAPMTFGEVASVRADIYQAAQRMIMFAVVLTLAVAACSLAVATAGGLVERRRPFTLLRLSGASSSSLYKVVFLESALPLAAAATVAGLTGYAMAWASIGALAPDASMTFPVRTYFSMIGGGAVVAALVIGGSLSLLERMTRTENARFE